MHFKYYKSERLILFIIGLAVLVGYFVTVCIHPLIEHAKEPYRTFVIYTEMFTVPFFVTIIFFIIDIWGWKYWLFKWLVDIPNLNGRYEGKVISSFTIDDNSVEIHFALEIVQTASSIHISSYYFNPELNEETASYSIIEEIEKQKNGIFKLFYLYTNMPGRLNKVLTQHDGTASAMYYPDIKKLDGGYYNSRKNTGQFEAVWVSEKLIHRYHK
ncbi:MAG: hypothetical protein JNJ86_14200 [Chitinophagaceae bacterium]|nr:hypothetical protein [Chitinophagaceae bacterium]